MRCCKTDNGHDLFTYDNISEMVAFCRPDLYRDNGADWFTGQSKMTTWSHVKAAVDRPDQAGIKIMEEMTNELMTADLPEVKSHMRKVRFNDFDGDEIDNDRLRSGQDYWRKSEREESSGPSEVTIITDISASACVSARDVYWRGAAAVALTSILEAAGYRVELWVIEGTKPDGDGGGKYILSAGCLKKTNDVLDVAGIINAISPWFYRTVDFTIVKTQAAYLNRCIYGVGKAYTPSRSDLNALTPDELRIFTAGAFSFRSALSMVKAELERISTTSISI